MAVYRFRVQFEEHEDVYRDIEIKSSQSFKEFHEAIQQAIGFDNKHAASFFVSDAYWRKGNEVTLLKEDVEEGVRLMEKTKIASCIEDPHQRFVYVYDKVATWALNIELLKITKDENGKFPSCVKSQGVAPKQYKPKTEHKNDGDLTQAAGLAALMQEMEDDDEAYKNTDNSTEEILDEEEARGVMGTDNSEGEDENEFGESGENDEGENEEAEEGENYGGYDDDER